MAVRTPTRSSLFLALVAAVAVLLVSEHTFAKAARKPLPQKPWGQIFLQLEAFGSLLNDGVGGSNLSVSAGYTGRVGWRRGILGLFGEVGCDRWYATETEAGFEPGVLDVGLGAHLAFLEDRLRVSLSGGLSRLLFDTAFHGAGTTGVYVDLRPASLRFHLVPGVVLELSPIGFAVMAPALDPPHIRRIEYRAAVLLEVAL